MLSPLGHFPSYRGAAAALICLLAASSFSAQEKSVLSLKGEPGASSRYKSTSSVEISAEGEKIKFESTEEQEVKLIKKDGANFVFEATTLSSTFTINGEKMEDDEEESKPSSVEMVIKPNGELISYKDKDPDADEDSQQLSLRMAQAGVQIFSANPVGVGDAWTHSFVENKELKTFAGKASFKLVGFEAISGAKVAKIEFTYEESGAPRNIKASGTNWVELASGEVVKSATNYENVPFDFGTGEDVVATASDTSERSAGGLAAPAAAAGGQAGAGGQTSAAAKPEEPKKEEPKKEEDKNSIDAKTKGWEKLDGLFTVYRKVENNRTKLNLEIKRSQLNKLFVLQTTFSTGSGSRVVAGNPVSDLVFEFREMPNNKVYLAVPNYFWRAPANPALEKALRRSFTDAVVESFDIEATQKDRDSLMIDISTLFTGNIGRVFEAVGGGGNSLAVLMGGGGGSFSPDREKTYMSEFKVFPTNIYAETIYAFNNSGRDTYNPDSIYDGSVPERVDARSLMATVVYNLYQIPSDSGYVPRRSDKRVGYFNVAHRDWSNPTARDQKVENILRWDLRKKDPSAALSEPVQPIVFHVDSAFPDRQKEVVRSALLSWNRAFEKIGFKNAVVVHLMDKTTTFDHADMRYNVVRLVASPSDAYAVALFRSNPITGQILNASITLDANFLRAIQMDWDRESPAEAFSHARGLVDKTEAERAAHAKSHGAACACSFQSEAAKRAAFGALALTLEGSGVSADRKEQFLDEYLYSVIQHEFGHILGLRHNFVASTQLTPEQLSDPEMVKKHNISSSVMDYVDFNTYALGRSDVGFFGREVGDYDNWAVRYGYLPTGFTDSDAEASFLKAIAAQGSKWGLEYQSDEQADGLDPYTRRFDLSSDPLATSQRIMALSRKLLFTLGDRVPKGGESYYEFTRMFEILMNRMATAAGESSVFIGGYRRSFAHAGDAGARKPMVPVPAATQRRALDVMLTSVFDEKSFDFPKEYYQKFAPNPKGDFGTTMMDAFNTYPVLDMVTGLQSSALGSLINSSLLRQLLNEEWKAPKGQDTMKASEVMDKVYRTVWTELEQGRPVSIVRRSLQRNHVDRLIELGVKQDSGRSEVNVLAWGQLRRLGDKLKAAKSGDSSTALHYEELAVRIDRALNAIQTLGGGGGGGRTLSLADLLGGSKP